MFLSTHIGRKNKSPWGGISLPSQGCIARFHLDISLRLPKALALNGGNAATLISRAAPEWSSPDLTQEAHTKRFPLCACRHGYSFLHSL